MANKFPAVVPVPVFALFNVGADYKALVGVFATHDDAVAFAHLNKVPSWHIDGCPLYPVYGSERVLHAARTIFNLGICSDARESVNMVRAEREKAGLPCE